MEPTNIWSIPLQIHSDRTKQWGLQHFKTIVFNQNIEIFNVIDIKMTWNLPKRFYPSFSDEIFSQSYVE